MLFSACRNFLRPHSSWISTPAIPISRIFRPPPMQSQSARGRPPARRWGSPASG